jgi:peroxiredoxin Q/BCP
MSNRQALNLGMVTTLIVSFMVACGGNAPTAEPTITDKRTASGPRVGDVAPDFTLPDKDGNMVRLADELKDHSSVVLVFYYEGTCDACQEQLAGLEKDRAAYERKGAQLIALAVQSQEGAAYTAQVTKAQYPILADAQHTVAEQYGVFDLPIADVGRSALPSTFIIEQNGKIVWLYVSNARAPAYTILENLP